MLGLLTAFVGGAVTATGLIYVGGKIILRKLGTVEPLTLGDLVEEPANVAEGPLFYASIHGVGYEVPQPIVLATRSRMRTDEGWADEIARRTVDYVILRGLENGVAYDEGETQLVADIARLAGMLTAEACVDADWFVIDRERLVALLSTANRAEFEQDEE